MNNPEYSLIALLLNYPENYEKLEKLPNIFQNKLCNYIFSVMQKQKNFNVDTIRDIVKDRIKDVAFDEIYESYFEEDQLDSYLDYVLSQYAKNMIIKYSDKLKRTDFIRYDQIKTDIEDITIKLDKCDEEIESSSEVIEKMQKENQENICKLVPSGITYFDRNGGFESTDLTYIAARTSQGKTSYALNLIGEDIAKSRKVGLFTTETKNRKIISLLACMYAGIEETKYRMNDISEEERNNLAKAFSILHERKIYLDGTPRLSIPALYRKARIMKKKYGVEKIYIDYLQRLEYQKKGISGKYELITELSKMVKILAVELDIPIICLVQLNRNNEKENREPRLTDLKGSGDIEQDGDNIIMLYHESVNDEGIIKIKNIVGKYRNGPTGSYYTLFNKQLRRIRDYG